MTGVYTKMDACWSWAAGTESSPVSEAAYPVQDDWTISPELRDVVQQFTNSSIYPLFSQITGKQMVGEIVVPAFIQPSIATVPPVYGSLLRAAAMSETDSGSTFVYAAAATGFATDDVVGTCYPKDIKLNIDGHLFPLFKNAIVNPTFELTAPGLPMIRCAILGQRQTSFAVDTAQVSATYPRNPLPLGDMTLTVTRVAPAVTGSVTTPDATGVTLTDSAATFLSSGVQPGDTVTNSTTSDTAAVVSITSETVLVTDGLAGGGDNEFGSSDAYSIAAGVVPVQRCPRAILPLGNSLQPQSGVGGTNGYHQPRIVTRTAAVYTLDVQMPLRSDFDWQREIDTASGNPARYMTFTLVHNSGGIAGSVLTFTFTAKPTGVAAISEGSDGTLMQTLNFEQHYSTGPLTLIVA